MIGKALLPRSKFRYLENTFVDQEIPADAEYDLADPDPAAMIGALRAFGYDLQARLPI